MIGESVNQLIFVVMMCMVRIAGLVCGTILVLNHQIWPGIVAIVIPFLAGGKFTSKEEETEQKKV